MNKIVTLAHGAGGVEMKELLERLIFEPLEDGLKKTPGGIGIDYPDDGAVFRVGENFIVISTDSYTVKPLFFPGGNIGTLAACGSLNDVLMMGGEPFAIVDSIVVPEGFPEERLREIIDSFIGVLRMERVPLIGGDLKVLPKDELDGLIVSTTALGHARRVIVDRELSPGDKIIVSGNLGEHGATILALQQGIRIEGKGLRSDVKPLTGLMKPLLRKYGDYIHAARDPTRGGLAMLLNDWASDTGTVILVYEEKLPVKPIVSSYAGMLGLDPLYLASEGVAVLGVEGSVAEEVLSFIRDLGFEDAQIIGEVRASDRYKGYVLYRSAIGGHRILEPPRGELVPRIC